MSDEKELSALEVQQKAYDALKSYRDEWKQIDVDKLVSDGVLKPVRGVIKYWIINDYLKLQRSIQNQLSKLPRVSY
jgi:hypothetical protein